MPSSRKRLRKLGVERDRASEQRLRPARRSGPVNRRAGLSRGSSHSGIAPARCAAAPSTNRASRLVISVAQSRAPRRTSRRETGRGADRRARDRRPAQNDLTASSYWPREDPARSRGRRAAAPTSDGVRWPAVNTCAASSNARSCSRLLPQSNRCSSVGAMCAARWYSVGRADEVARALFDVAEQVVELGRVLARPSSARSASRASSSCPVSSKRERQVVAAGVVGRVDGAGALQVRQGRLELAAAAGRNDAS